MESRLGAEMKEKVTNVNITQSGDAALFDIPTADKDKVRASVDCRSVRFQEA